MACELCNSFFDDGFLCVNVPNGGTLQYGVALLGVQPGPGLGETSVFYQVCNCNATGTGISHINFEFCVDGVLPNRVLVNGEEVTLEPEGDDYFPFPNFKVEEFGDIAAGSCLVFQLVYSEEFDETALQEGSFGLKIGGGSDPALYTGYAFGLLVPCVALNGCTPNVVAEVCTQANVTIIPTTVAGAATVTCLGDPQLNVQCVGRPGFEPIPPGGYTFNISQVMCVTFPVDFSVDVVATPGQSAIGPIGFGTECASEGDD